MVKNFRESKICESFSHKYKPKILEFIELLCSQDSKLNSVSDLDERRRQAADLAGLDIDKPGIYEITHLEDEEVNELIFHFMCIQNTNGFNNLWTYQRLLWRYQRMLNKPFPEDEEKQDKALTFRSKLRVECEALEASIARLTIEIFGRGQIADIATDNVRKMYTLESRLKEYKEFG